MNQSIDRLRNYLFEIQLMTAVSNSQINSRELKTRE
jgi:hypothetical protein